MSEIQAKSKKRALLVFVGCCVMQALGLGTVLNSSAAFFAGMVPVLGEGFVAFSTWITAYGIAALVGTLLGGILIPKFGPRLIISLDVIISALVVASFAAVDASTPAIMYIIRGAILGLFGGQFFLYAAPVLMNAWFGKDKLGSFLGIVQLMSGVGGAIFPFVFTALITGPGYKTAYIVNAIILLVILIFSLTVFSLDPAKIGLEKWGKQDSEDTAATSAKPGVPLKYALPTAAFIFLLIGCLFSSYPGSFNSYVQANAQLYGVTPTASASLMMFLQAGYIVASLLGGILCDKIGPKIVTIAIYLIAIVMFVLFMFVHSFGGLAIVCFFFGMNNAAVTISVPFICKECFGNKSYDKVLSYGMMAVGLGGSIGAPILASVYASTGSYTMAFASGAIVFAISLIALLIALAASKGVRAKHWED